MINFALPEAHPLKARWIPLYYYPTLGSKDCLTVAIAAFADNGDRCVVASSGLDRLKCFYGSAANGHIEFLTLAINAFRDAVNTSDSFDLSKFHLGSSFQIGEMIRGSGYSVEDIAHSWLSKISVIHEKPSTAVVQIEDLDLVTKPKALRAREPNILKTIKSEVQQMDARLVSNFDTEFHPKGRQLSVRLGYSGENLVASFDRVPPNKVESSLERIRSKLWLLAEHRDQTLHEKRREHEMLVVPTEKFLVRDHSREMNMILSACSDMEKEADRREIRFRRFDTSHEAAQHIFSMEKSGRPMQLMN